MEPIKFTVYGEPVPKLRPRVVFRANIGRAIAISNPKTVSYEDAIRHAASLNRPPIPMTDMLALTINVYRSIPKSMSKKKRELAIKELLRPISRPDLDNYVKVKDALNGIIWKDDSQVVRIIANKYYSEMPRIEFEIFPIGIGRLMA